MTGAQLKLVVPTLTQARADVIADRMNFVTPAYRMNTPDILHEFVANVAHESGGFRLTEENMNYSVARLKAIWPSRFKVQSIAERYAHNPKALAILVYGSRMGNRTGADDGWTFRGGGYAHLTGREAYTKYGKHIDFKNIEQLAEAVRKDEFYALDSACWLFAIEKKLIYHAEQDNFITIVKRWNGGVIGLSDRQAYYERAKKYIV